MKILNIFIFTLIILFFSNCFNRRNIIVLTDIKIIPFYINIFNIENSENFILKYRDLIDKQTIENENPDILISNNIDKIPVNQYLKNIKEYYKPNYMVLDKIAKKYFYKILPINFDFPILIYKNSYKIKKYIDLEEFKKLYKKFEKEKKIFISPYISKDLFYILSELHGVNFNFLNENILYNEKNLQNTFNYLNSFLDKNELFLQKNFADKYGYLKLEKLLLLKNSNLISGLSSIEFYNNLDKEIAKELNFSYITNNEKKTVIFNLSFIGIKRLSNSVEKFIKWILDKKVEKKLIKLKNEAKFYDNFGLINGFTPYKELNLNIEKEKINNVPIFIIDESKIEKNSYITNTQNLKNIEKINNWFILKIENPDKKQNFFNKIKP